MVVYMPSETPCYDWVFRRAVWTNAN